MTRLSRAGLSRRYGSLIVRELIPHDEARRLVGIVDRVFASFDGGRLDDPWFSPFPGRDDQQTEATRAWLRTKGGVLTGDSPRATFEVADVFMDVGIGRLAQDYLGQPPILSLDKWTIRRGAAENGTEWHQDGAFLGGGVLALHVWLALTECGTDAPSLDVVPRRLDGIVATGTEGASFSWSVAEGVAARVAGAQGWCRPRFRPGDALLFDDKLLHRTGADPGMRKTRYAIETWFFALFPGDRGPPYSSSRRAGLISAFQLGVAMSALQDPQPLRDRAPQDIMRYRRRGAARFSSLPGTSFALMSRQRSGQHRILFLTQPRSARDE